VPPVRGMYTFVAMINRKTGFPFLVFFAISFSIQANAAHGFAHSSGADLVDSANQPLMLRGINLGNWLEPEGYMFHFTGGPQSPREIEDLTTELLGPDKAAAFWQQWRETYITESDVDRIKSAGFNSIRVPIHWRFFDSDDADGFRLLDRLIQWARKDGIYVIIDLHCAPGGTSSPLTALPTGMRSSSSLLSRQERATQKRGLPPGPLPQTSRMPSMTCSGRCSSPANA